MEKTYLYEFDDPYKLLAATLVGTPEYGPTVLTRMLTDDAFIRSLVIKETRGQDIRGPFLDCVIENILVDKRRMEYMHEMDKLANYYFENLDLEKLRHELKAFAKECGFDLEA